MYSDVCMSDPFHRGGSMSKMEVKTSLLDNMIGVGDMVLLEPLSEETFIGNLQKRFEHNEIYVSSVKFYIFDILSLDVEVFVVFSFNLSPVSRYHTPYGNL